MKANAGTSAFPAIIDTDKNGTFLLLDPDKPHLYADHKIYKEEWNKSHRHYYRAASQDLESEEIQTLLEGFVFDTVYAWERLKNE